MASRERVGNKNEFFSIKWRTQRLPLVLRIFQFAALNFIKYLQEKHFKSGIEYLLNSSLSIN